MHRKMGFFANQMNKIMFSIQKLMLNSFKYSSTQIDHKVLFRQNLFLNYEWITKVIFKALSLYFGKLYEPTIGYL